MLFAIFYFTKLGLSPFIVLNLPHPFTRYLKILALDVKSYAPLKSLRTRESRRKDWIPGQARNDKARRVSIQLWTD